MPVAKKASGADKFLDILVSNVVEACLEDNVQIVGEPSNSHQVDKQRMDNTKKGTNAINSTILLHLKRIKKI